MTSKRSKPVFAMLPGKFLSLKTQLLNAIAVDNLLVAVNQNKWSI
jgi:hypothetical protein